MLQARWLANRRGALPLSGRWLPASASQPACAYRGLVPWSTIYSATKSGYVSFRSIESVPGRGAASAASAPRPRAVPAGGPADLARDGRLPPDRRRLTALRGVENSTSLNLLRRYLDGFTAVGTDKHEDLVHWRRICRTAVWTNHRGANLRVEQSMCGAFLELRI